MIGDRGMLTHQGTRYQGFERRYATLDAERQEKYVLNDKGADFLHTYIEQISATFIEFLKKKQFSCYDTNAIHCRTNESFA